MRALFTLLITMPAMAADEELSFAVNDVAFPSGLRVAVVADASLPVLGVKVIVDAGWSVEPAAHPSLAHLVEHLWFRSRPAKGTEVGERLDAAACTSNAHTDVDHATFELTCPATARSELLALIAALVEDPLQGLTPEAIAQEERTVRAELVERDQRGGLSVFDGLMSAVHPAGHPYGHRALDPDAVKYDAAAARTFVDDSYRNGRATVVISGDVGTSVEKVLEDLFAQMTGRSFHPDLPRKPLARFPVVGGRTVQWPADPEAPTTMLRPGRPTQRVGTRAIYAPDGGGRATIQAPVEEAPWIVAWRMPPAAPVEAGFEAWSLAAVLQESAAGALGTVGVDQLDCSAMMLAEETLAWCEVVIGEKFKPESVLARLKGLEFDVRLPLITEYAEAPRYRWGKRYLYGQLEAPADPYGWRLQALADYLHQGGYADLLSTSLDQLATGQTWRVAGVFLERNLSSKRMWTVQVQSTASPSSLVTDGVTIETQGAAAPLSSEALASVPTWPTDRVAERVLDTGLRLVAVRTGTVPFADVALIMPRGGAAHDASLDRLLQHALRWDAPTASVPGLDVSIRSASGWTELVLRAGADELNETLRVLAYGVRSLKVDGARIASFRTWARRQQHLLDERGMRPWYDHVRAALPSLDVGVAGLDTAAFDTLMAVDKNQLSAILASRWAPEGALLLMVGDLDPQAALDRSAQLFKGWRDAVQPAPQLSLPAPAPEPSVVAIVNDRTMAEVSLDCVAVDTHPSFLDAAVLDEVLQRAVTAEQRVARGLAYTPVASSARVGDHLRVSMSATVAASDAAAVVGLQRALLDRVIAGGLAARDVTEAASRYKLGAPLRRQTRSQIRVDLRSAWLDGHGVQDWASVAALAGDVSPGSLAARAAGCPLQLVVTVDGPKGAADAVGAALGLPVHVVTPSTP